MRSNETNCISLSNGFGARSLGEVRVKTENLLFTFAVEGVINSEILRSFTELLFSKKKQVNFKILISRFLGTFFGRQYRSPGMKLALDTGLGVCKNGRFNYGAYIWENGKGRVKAI